MTRNNRYFVLTLLIAATSVCLAAQVYTNIPAGTSLQVRIIDKLSSETANVGDSFQGTLAAPVVVNGRTLFSKGTDVTGEVLRVERSGRLSTPGELHLILRTIRSAGRTYNLEPFMVKGESHAKSNVTKIGGGAGLGALIGAIAGGGKGAAIGAGVGAAAGTGVAAGTGKKPAEVESEAVLTWVTATPPAGAVMQGQERQSSRNRYDDDDDRDRYRRSRSNDRDED